MRVVSMLASKGGSGKTTVITNTASAIASKHPTLIIDLDPQGSLSDSILEHLAHEGTLTSAGVLAEAAKSAAYRINPSDLAVVELPTGETLHLLPSWEPDELALAAEQLLKPGGESALKRAIQDLPYKVAFIDTAPSVSRLTVNAITAATHVMSVFTEHRWSVEGALAARDYVQEAREFSLTEAKFIGAVANRVKARKTAQAQVVLEIAKERKLKVLKTEIPERVGVQEGELIASPVVLSSPKSQVAQAFRSLADEVWRLSR